MLLISLAYGFLRIRILFPVAASLSRSRMWGGDSGMWHRIVHWSRVSHRTKMWACHVRCWDQRVKRGNLGEAECWFRPGGHNIRSFRIVGARRSYIATLRTLKICSAVASCCRVNGGEAPRNIRKREKQREGVAKSWLHGSPPATATRLVALTRQKT